MKKNQKNIKQQEKKDAIALMEYQDLHGIRRKRFRPAFFTEKKVFIIRLILLISLPVAYFVYSPLLIVFTALYGLLYFVIKNVEKNLNHGMKKHLHVKLRKLDAFLALVIVIFVVLGVGLSAATTSTKSSMFTGSKAQIRAMMEERGMSSGKINEMIQRMDDSGVFLSDFSKSMLKISTLYTGHREFFTTKNQMAVRGLSFKGSRVRISNGSRPPEGSAPPDGVNISEGRPNFGSVPFEMIFEQILTVIAFAGLLAIEGAGIFFVIKNFKKPPKFKKGKTSKRIKDNKYT